MLSPACSASLADLARSGYGRAQPRIVVAVVEAARPAPRPAAKPQPRPLADRLRFILATNDPMREPSPARAAAAAFSAGDGYLSGQMVDRVI